MKFAKKVDDNQKVIVSALRAQGCFVHPSSAVGMGVPDLMVGYHGKWHLLEVKDGGKPVSERKLTQAQREWILSVQNRAPVHVVETVEQALAVVRGAA